MITAATANEEGADGRSTGRHAVEEGQRKAVIGEGLAADASGCMAPSAPAPLISPRPALAASNKLTYLLPPYSVLLMEVPRTMEMLSRSLYLSLILLARDGWSPEPLVRSSFLFVSPVPASHRSPSPGADLFACIPLADVSRLAPRIILLDISVSLTSLVHRPLSFASFSSGPHPFLSPVHWAMEYHL